MSILKSLQALFSNAFPRSSNKREMEEELRSHIEHRADDLERRGVPRSVAERRARVEFGGYVKYTEQSYEAAGSKFIESFLQDLRLAMRKLRNSPGFTVAAVLTLALAIGANAVVFSVMSALLLRPLNVPDAQNLYELQRGNEASGYLSYPNYLDLRDRNRSFDGLAAWSVSLLSLDTGQNLSRSWAEETTGNYFDALRLKPYLGRFFHSSDEHGPNSAPYIVLNYAFWHNHFQEDRAVIGRVVQVGGHPYTILGVAPPDFHGVLLFFNPDFFTPIINHGQLDGDDLYARGVRIVFMTMGHLKPGVTRAQAIADLDSVGSYLTKTYPKDVGQMTFSLASPTLYGDYLGGPVKAFMAGLMLLSSLILIAACANLGSLFAARAADGAREVALRLALGSSRKRILRGLFAEALVVSLAGGTIGLSLSVVLLRALSAWQPFPKWPLQLSVNPDANVYLVALLLALVSGLLFGAVPIRQILRANPYEVVKGGSASIAGRRVTLRDILLLVQIAICAVLVTSSLVAVRGLIRSVSANFGFDIQNTTLVDADVAATGEQATAKEKQMIDALKTIPGVDSVAMAESLPLGGDGSSTMIFADKAADLRPSNAAFSSDIFNVSPGYFQSAGTAMLSGRDFTWHDDKSAPGVAIINTEFARRIFGSPTGAIDGFFKTKDGTRLQVVGIAETGKYQSLTEDPQPAFFRPYMQSAATGLTLLVHTGPTSGISPELRNRELRNPDHLGPAIRTKLRRIDARMPVFVRTRFSDMETILFGPRMATIALGVLGILGALLSITGIFGMAAFSVSKRLRELGIRIALGAQRKEVLQAALGRPLKLLAAGSTVGLLLGLMAAKVLAYIVYQANPRDPIVLIGVVLAMLLLGLVATWIPARRALAVDPMILLREE